MFVPLREQSGNLNVRSLSRFIVVILEVLVGFLKLKFYVVRVRMR